MHKYIWLRCYLVNELSNFTNGLKNLEVFLKKLAYLT